VIVNREFTIIMSIVYPIGETNMSNQETVEVVEAKEEGQLLSPRERDVCVQISSEAAPHSQRAQALLAIDVGATQQQAAQQAGLTEGQVKYWLGKFRKEGLDIFPELEVKDAEPEAVIPEPETPVMEKSVAESSKKSKKSKKTKKSKGKKGKDVGGKKGKKSKEKAKSTSKKAKGKKSKEKKGKDQAKKKKKKSK
jgi:hypothetical protein